MKFCCDSRKYFESLNSEDKEKFQKYFRNRTFDQMPFIWTSIWEEMTEHQRGAIWLDFTKVARLLECDKEDIYYMCLTDEELLDIWKVEYSFGIGEQRKYRVRLRTLSELSKDEMTMAIPRIRDFLQGIVNQEYQQNVVINWSKIKNVGKPDAEFMNP